MTPLFLDKNYDFEGIIKLSNCSGSLVRLETSKDIDKAMVFTNGHCLEGGMPAPNTFVTNKPSSRRFSLLDSRGEVVATLNAELIVYSSMTRTDLTIYRLKETYSEILKKYNIRAFMVDSNHPQVGENIDVISGYWEAGYSCKTDFFVYELHEDGWVSNDSIRYTPGCQTIPGTSGSPIIREGTRTQIGINNTGNDDGEKCTLNNPCEVSENGNIFYKKDLRYGQQTFWVYSCLGDNNSFNLKKEGCLLFH